MNKFVFIAPMYNASKTLPRMLHSIVGQSYTNWRLILIDDISTHEEQVACNKIIFSMQELMSRSQASPNSISVTWNSDGRGKKWETENVLYGVSMCDDDDIVCRIDADDFLCDLDALRIMNEVYDTYKPDCLWTAHRWFDDKVVATHNISNYLPDTANPYHHPWVTSHLKSFRKCLINDVKDENFRGKTGDYIRRAGDQALYLPILHRANKRMYLPMVIYAYRCDMSAETFMSEDAKFQKKEAEFLRKRGFVE